MMYVKDDEPLWVEKYRPQRLSDAILPKDIKETLQGFVANDFVPNVILAGGPGVGKTTAARSMLDEMGADYYFINGSMKGNIDTLRTDVSDFASSVSLTGKRKYVLIDEADYLNANSTQPALRGFMEEFSRNCGFILTCNYASKLIEPLHSRCPTIEFSIPPDECQDLAGEFFERMCAILDNEGVTYVQEVVAEIITQHFPDWRKVIGILQKYASKHKTIDTGVLSTISDEEVRKLFTLLKSGSNFSKVREWVAKNSTDHPKDLYRLLYQMSGDFLEPAGIAQLVITLNRYEYHSAFVANQEINLMASLAEIMAECAFK
jgi:DNA polymerase III delta prime subunit